MRQERPNISLADSPWKKAAVTSDTWRIWIAGDYDDARRCVRRYAMSNGFCAAVQEAAYVYTGGEEAGVCVTLIHYARFPAVPGEIAEKAEALGRLLADALCQSSFSVEGPNTTEYHSRRGD